MCNCNKAYTGYNPCGCNPGYSNIPLINTNCGTCEEELGCINTDAKCVIFTGETDPCTGIESGDNFEIIVGKIGAILCETGIDPDYSGYDMACLGELTTQSEFVEAISNYVCLTRTDLDALTTSYNNYVISNNAAILAIRVPGTTGCTAMPIAGGSTIQQILQIYSDRLCEVSTAIEVASLDWSNCFTVITPPTNVYEGFEEVLRQICLVNSNPVGQDTYKVKLSSLDNTEDYLSNKIKGSGCITISPVLDLGINKLQLGLGFTPNTFNFDPAQFDVTTGTNDGCVQTYNVTLDSSITTGYILPPATVGVLGGVKVGTGLSVAGDGTLSTSGSFVTQVELALPASTFSISGSPVTGTGTLTGTFISQNPNTFFMGPVVGPATTPTWRTVVTADLADNIISYNKIQQVTAKRLLGNYTVATGNTQEITVGAGLTLDNSGVLSANSVTGGGTPVFTPFAGWSYVLETGSSDDYGTITLTSPALAGSDPAEAGTLKISAPKTIIMVPVATLEDGNSVSVGTPRSVVVVGNNVDEMKIYIAKDNILLGQVYKVHYQIRGI